MLNFIISDGSLGRTTANQDNVSAMVFGCNFSGSTSSLPFEFGKTYEITESKKLVSLIGLTKAIELQLRCPIFDEVDSYFQDKPNRKLFFMFVNQVNLETICNKAQPYLMKLLNDAEGDVRRAGVITVTASTAGASTTYPNIPAYLQTAILNAQEIATEQLIKKSPVSIWLGYNNAPVTAGGFLNCDLRVLDCPDIRVSIYADKPCEPFTSPTTIDEYAQSVKLARVGSVLGKLADIKVGENIGWVLKGNLTWLNKGIQAQAYFAALDSDGRYIKAKTMISDWRNISNNGFTFVVKHNGRNGVYFYDSATCGKLDKDFYSHENVEVVGKSIRLLYDRILDYQNSPILVNPDNGQIAAETVVSLETAGEEALKPMKTNGEISGYRVYVDPNQNIFDNDNKIIIKFWDVPLGVAREIEGHIALVPVLPTLN